MESNNNDFKLYGANFSYWNKNPNSFEKVLNTSKLRNQIGENYKI